MNISAFAASSAPMSAVVGTGSICQTQTQACTTANPCNIRGLTSGTNTNYGIFTSDVVVGTAAQVCSLTVGLAAAASPPVTWSALCTTSNCNAPGASTSGAPTTAAALAVVLAAAAAVAM